MGGIRWTDLSEVESSFAEDIGALGVPSFDCISSSVGGDFLGLLSLPEVESSSAKEVDVFVASSCDCKSSSAGSGVFGVLLMR